jgi:hypothetical protein
MPQFLILCDLLERILYRTGVSDKGVSWHQAQWGRIGTRKKRRAKARRLQS